MCNILTKTLSKNDFQHKPSVTCGHSFRRLVTVHFLFLLITLATATSAQFLHRNGKMIVDGDNNEIILRGMGLGGWMLQEGYMLETNAFANPQHEIRAKILDLIGPSNTDEFYEKWLTNFCTKRDIDSLASWGFNSVRLPLHYNLFTLPIETVGKHKTFG
jgi:aryl-phospho-beta-D-glucosidase BglC (GH1 family)